MSSPATPEVPGVDHDRRPRTALPWWAWLVAAAAIYLASVIGVLFAPVGTNVAVWWPSAGLAVLFMLLQPRASTPHVLLLVVVVTAAANMMGGRPPLVALMFSLANAAEVAVIAAILYAPGRRFELSSLRAGLRFAVAVMAGAATVGVGAAGAVALLEGGDFWPTVVFVAASHAAAVAMIAPLGALPPSMPSPAGRIEMAAQALLLTAVIGLVFHPDASLPLAFAPFPLLAWAALRFPLRFVLAETIVGSLLMVVLTLDGGGPFRTAGLDLLVGAALFELLLVTFAGFGVVLSAAQYELRALARQLGATNRLLSGSVIDARIGLVVAERGEDETRVRWLNPAATAMLAAELRRGVWRGPLRSAAVSALRSGEQVTVDTGDGRTITVAANEIEGGGHRITVQLLDVTAVLRAQQVQLEAEIERDAARSIRAELERQRDDFLVTTSHELRTPITSIVGYAGLLSGAEALADPEREWVRIIDRNAHRLSDLVEDLLTLSRTGATPPPQPRPERLTCAALFDEVAANLRVVSERNRLRVLQDPGGQVVFASRSDTSRMLSNLLVNACKFTPPGGTIRLSAHAAGATVRILVADSGPGMSETELSHAFDRFYRAPGAERDNVPGTGLGLAIVAELAKRNGGSVQVRAGERGGLVAELQLPAARLVPP